MDIKSLDVLVIGAGQAGLVVGYYLQQSPQRYNYLLVDGNTQIGDSWRNRYDSLTLFTPRSYSALPGLPVPGDPEGYPSKDEIADYLSAYAERFQIPMQMSTRVERLERANDHFHAEMSNGEKYESLAVILATGAFQVPAVPALAKDFSPDVQQFNAATYRSPNQLPGGTVLVVGDGATGRQFALEIAARQPVVLSTGYPRRVVPQRVLGRDIFWWADRFGLLDAPHHSRAGRYLLRGDSFPGRHWTLPNLRKAGVRVENRLVRTNGNIATFANQRWVEINSVVWATGYREDDRWVDVPYAKNPQGSLIHYRGVSPAPGLFVVGRSWQWSRGSALLHGVGKDAQFILRVLDYHLSDLFQRPAGISLQGPVHSHDVLPGVIAR